MEERENDKENKMEQDITIGDEEWHECGEERR